jgi:hypothetical protein
MIVRGHLTRWGGAVATALAALAAAAILLLTALGCSGSGPAQTGAAATTAPGVTAGAAPEASVTIVDAPSSAPLDLPHLGTVSYSVDDTVKAVTAPVSVKEDTVLKLTDSRGLTYELVVPAGSITQRISITMRALTGLSSTTVPGELLGGVLLEPDGLRFAVPATLTVTGSRIGDSIRFLTGNQDGTSIDLVEGAAAAGSAKATVWHFSPEIVSDWENVAKGEVESQAKAKAQAVLDGIAAVLKDPQIKVTPPPSMSLECGDEVTEMLDEQVLDYWLRTADEPETELLRAAIDSMNLYNLLGWDSTAQQDAARKLLFRQEARVGKLIQQYGGDREKMLAIAAYGMIVVRNMELMGNQALEGEERALASKIANYVASFIDPLISDIKTKHDYKMMRPAFLVARWAGLLGANDVKLDEGTIGERIYAAMTFKVETTLTLNWPEQEWVLKSTSDITFSPDSASGKFKLTGDGTGSFVSYMGAVPATAPSFPVTVTLESFDPCAGTATFAINRHGPDTEEYDFGDGDVKSISMTKASWESIFKSRLKDGVYRFPVTLQNGQATIIDQSFDGTSPSQKVTGTLQIKVTHTPK